VNNFQTVYIAEDKEKLTEDYYKSTAADDTISASAASVMPNGVSSKKRFAIYYS
jgi:hypothetical protein